MKRIARRYSDGWTLTELSEYYEISVSTLEKRKQREGWTRGAVMYPQHKEKLLQAAYYRQQRRAKLERIRKHLAYIMAAEHKLAARVENDNKQRLIR